MHVKTVFWSFHVSCDEANSHLRTVTVIPFSSKIERVFPFEVLVSKSNSGLELDSKVKVTQTRASVSYVNIYLW